MDVTLTRIPDGDATPNQCIITLPEGTITIIGTGGFVVGALAALFAPGTVVSNLVLEHVELHELRAAWAQAARDAGYEFPPL